MLAKPKNPEAWGVCKDGGMLCPRCLVTEAKNIKEAPKYNDDQWHVIGYEVPENGTPCDHCGSCCH